MLWCFLLFSNSAVVSQGVPSHLKASFVATVSTERYRFDFSPCCLVLRPAIVVVDQFYYCNIERLRMHIKKYKLLRSSRQIKLPVFDGHGINFIWNTCIMHCIAYQPHSNGLERLGRMLHVNFHSRFQCAQRNFVPLLTYCGSNLYGWYMLTLSQLLPLHACSNLFTCNSHSKFSSNIEHLDRFCQEDTMHLASDVCWH